MTPRPPGQVGGRFPSVPAVHLRPASRRAAVRTLVAAGQPVDQGGLVDHQPDGTPVDFLAFARTEGRFAGHFGPNGEPSPEILATQADRLANWRTLQELAGIL